MPLTCVSHPLFRDGSLSLSGASTAASDALALHALAAAPVRLRTLPCRGRTAAALLADAAALLDGESAAAPHGLLVVGGSAARRGEPPFGRDGAAGPGEAPRAADALVALRLVHGPRVALLGVVNPSSGEPAAHAAAKLDAGANALITQPALDAAAFERWWAGGGRGSVPSGAPVIVGLPFLASARQHAFWRRLSGLDTDAPWKARTIYLSWFDSHRLQLAFLTTRLRGRAPRPPPRSASLAARRRRRGPPASTARRRTTPACGWRARPRCTATPW